MSYKRGIVWKALKRAGKITCVDLAERMQLERRHLTRILWGLRKDGFADNGGNVGLHTLYWALGDKPPECMVGKNPNSLKRLNTNPNVARQRIAKALAARGKTLRVQQETPVSDGCLLAQCWSSASCTKKVA